MFKLIKNIFKQTEIRSINPLPEAKISPHKHHNAPSQELFSKHLIDDQEIMSDVYSKFKIIAKPSLPTKNDHKLTVFFPIDDFLAYTIVPSNHFGINENEAANYDYRIDFPEYQTFVYVFLRPDYDKFIDFLAENTEPVVYTTAEPIYTNRLMVLR